MFPVSGHRRINFAVDFNTPEEGSIAGNKRCCFYSLFASNSWWSLGDLEAALPTPCPGDITNAIAIGTCGTLCCSAQKGECQANFSMISTCTKSQKLVFICIFSAMLRWCRFRAKHEKFYSVMSTLHIYCHICCIS